MNRKIRELKRRARQVLGLRNTFGDRIIIEDEVIIYQGDKLIERSKGERLEIKSMGHIVSQGLIGLVNLIGGGTVAAPLSYQFAAKTGGIIHVGTGTGVTTAAMTSLVTDVVTDANTQSGAIASPAAGTYRVSWIATWNAGSLAAIDVSELGLSLYLDPTLNVFEAAPLPLEKSFFSRLSDSDGDFTTFTVNVAVPLTIEWRLTFTFA